MEEAFKINQNRNQKTTKVRNDSAVQGTNDSSVLSKISAAELGYVEDEFLKYFASKFARRSPLVNRGYYIRAKLIDYAIKNFLNELNKDSISNQFVNLGAGFDSTFFRLNHLNMLKKTLFIEIDFPEVINRKINLIKMNAKLNALCPDLEKVKDINGNIVYHSRMSNYFLIGVDLRNTKLLEAILKTVDGFQETDPTFLLSEVVLTYMSVNSCNGVLQWISEMFSNCCLAIYEQINPHDGFGQVMCTHFRKLGSALKCIVKYPGESDQIHRYKLFGFSSSYSLKASDFYLYNISDEEKLRIDKLELFDEYEAWHLKCSHYSLFTTTKGDLCDRLMKNFNEQTKSTYDRLDQSSVFALAEPVKIRPFEVRFGARFGHTMCCIGSRLFVFGGFGELATDVNGKHLRLSAVEVCDLDRMTLTVLDVKPALIGDRIFFSCSTWHNNTALVTLGRSNPSKLFHTIVKIEGLDRHDLNEENLSFHSIPMSSGGAHDYNLARFRHATALTCDSQLFIYGGKYFDDSSNVSYILNDAYLIDHSNSIKPVQVDEKICRGRHSHSMCTWNNYIIISGGLDVNEQVLNDVILFDCTSCEFKKITLNNGYVYPRYSHTSHIIGDFLVLIGGANFLEIPPGICFINLVTYKAYEFRIPVQIQDGTPLIGVCHQTHILDKNSILLVGGGAVCFTFGTHLNKQPIVFDISDCWSFIDSN